MKTKIEIIEETVKYYSEDVSRRAVNVLCEYLTDDGRMCAVGRCLYNVKQAMDEDVEDWSTHEEFFTPVWKKGYAGHEKEFWVDLQNLHDVERYWNDKGLTDLGKNQLLTLKKQYAQ